MIPKLWFRFGVPLGSATIITALLDLALAGYWFLNDFGSYLYFHVWDHELPTDYRTVIGLTAVTAKLLLAALLWIFVFFGHKGILVFWLPLSVIADILLIGHGINNCTHSGTISDEIWFLNLAVIIILRLYLTSIISQAFNRLNENDKAEAQSKIEEEQSGPSQYQNGNGNGSHVTENSHANANAKSYVPVTSLHRKTYQGVPRPKPKTPKYLEIDPIGKSMDKIWEFYDDTPRLGGVILTIFELVWNIFVLSTRALTEFLLGGKLFFMPKEEEIFMRVWRILLGAVALFFLCARRKTLLRFWLIGYFWTLFASLCIFVYILIDWVDTPTVVILVLCTTCFWDNILRFGILYFCLRVTTQPPPNVDLERTPSLRSRYENSGGTSRTSRLYLDHLSAGGDEDIAVEVS